MGAEGGRRGAIAQAKSQSPEGGEEVKEGGSLSQER